MNESRLDFEVPPEFADCGSLNRQTLARLRRALLSAANASGSQGLVVRLPNVRRGGAGLISVLLEVHQRLRGRGDRLRVREARDEVACVLETCRLRCLFDA